MRYCLIVLLLAAHLCGCTNRQVYEAVKTNQQNQCDLLQNVQREDCLKHLPPAYSDYERERQNLNKK